jgi:hypothetical protein
LNEAASIDGKYDEALGSFSVGFFVINRVLIPYLERLGNKDTPIHAFCACKIDHPQSRVDCSANIMTLGIAKN